MWAYSLLVVLSASSVAGAGLVSLDARDTEVVDVLQQLSAQANVDIVVGPGVKGRITLFLSDVDISRALQSVAAAGGWAVYREAGVFRFMTREDYERLTGEKFGVQTVMEVIPLPPGVGPHLGATLGSLASPGGKVVVDPEATSVVVVDRPWVVEQVRRMVEALSGGREMASFPVRWLSPQEAARHVSEVLGPSASVTPDPWRQRILVSDTPERLATLKPLMDSLDVPPSCAPVHLPLSFLPAESLAGLTSRLQALRPGRTITPTGGGLLVEDTPQGVDAVRELLAQVDVPSPTLRIDAKILQVSLSKETRTGIDWQALAERMDGLTLRAAFPMEGQEGIFARVGEVQDDKYTVLLGMLETLGKVELIARPTLLSHSGAVAELMVGSRVPYVTVDSREDNSGNVVRYQRVTYLPVGLSLWVKPLLHPNGTVTLQVRPELSSINDYVVAADARYPVVETANANLSLTTPLDRSIVIGGLIRETTVKSSRGVPLLRGIPLLGTLFRFQVQETRRAELVILLRPSLAPAEDLPADRRSPGIE